MDRQLQVSGLSNNYVDNRIIDQSQEEYKNGLTKNLYQNNMQQSVFEQQQTKSINNNKEINDPYDILQLDRNANVNDLKKAYIRLAKVYHPDRGGSAVLFNIIEEAYQTLLNKLSYTNEHRINKAVINQDYEDNINKPVGNVYVDKDNFNVNKFNDVFNEYRIGDANDGGYGVNMDSSTKLRKDYEQEKMFNGGFNKNTFNSTFKKKNTTKDIMVYEQPIAYQQNTKVSYQELGQDKIDNYGGISDGGRLAYTDYMHAHNENRKYIDTDTVDYKKYKDINALKRDRANISHKLSETDRIRIEQMKRREEAAEKQRLDRISFQDRKWESQHNQLNRLFIKQ